MAGSGSNPSPGKDPSFASPSPTDETTPSTSPLRILIVEDNIADAYLIRQAIKTSRMNTVIEIAKDGETATALLDQADRDETVPCPGLLILDINLPKKSGHEVLEHMLQSPRCRHTPVIVVSTSDSDQDRERATSLGAAYFRKSSEFDEFMKLGEVIRNLFPPAN